MKTSRSVLLTSVCLCAALSASATTWSYTPGENGGNGSITDGQWTFSVKQFDKANGVLALGSKTGFAAPEDETKKGVLDLSSPLLVTDSSNSSAAPTTVTNVVIGTRFLSWCSDVVEIRCDIIGGFEDGDGYYFCGNENLTNVVLGGSATVLKSRFLGGNKALKEVKLNFPNVREVGDAKDSLLFGDDTNLSAPLDVQTIVNSSVTNVYAHALENCGFVTGDLVMANVVSLGESAFARDALSSVSLKGPLASLTNLVFLAQDNNVTLTNVVLDLPNLGTVAADAFKNQQYVRRLELVSAPKDMGQVTNILASVATGRNLATDDMYYMGSWNQKKDVRIYVSKRLWTKPQRDAVTNSETNPDGYFLDASTFTDDEKKMIADDPTLAKAFGVLVVKQDNGTLVRHAFFVDKPSPYDPGLILIIR